MRSEWEKNRRMKKGRKATGKGEEEIKGGQKKDQKGEGKKEV